MDTEESLIEPQNASTYPELLRAAAAAYGDDTAISLSGDSIPDESLSFVELERQSAELARGLIAHGVGKGTRVAFIFGNGPGFALAFSALARIGSVAIPISTLIKANELVRVLRQSDASGLLLQRKLLGKDYVERVCDALPALRSRPCPELRVEETPYLRWIASTGDDLPPSFRRHTWLTEAAATVSEELLQAMEAEVTAADQLMEIYTSGSMALPKGVKHNHGPVMFRTHYLRRMTPAARRGAKLPAVLPMFWVGGLGMYLLPNLEAGATTVCTERTLSDSRVAMGSVLAEDDEFHPPEGWTIWALGMTETMGPYSHADQMRVPGYPLCAPLDHIADGFEVRVADAQGEPVPPGEKGEIQVRGYALTPGLHKLEREGYFTADGFYHTGDMGVQDGERILFVGRDGDMIKTANSNVAPAEVEMEMQQLEGVHSAYVVGLPDEELGQLLVAAVVPRGGAAIDGDALQEQLRQRLSSYKVPRVYVIMQRDEIPMLHSNKVARREIARIIANRLGRRPPGGE